MSGKRKYVAPANARFHYDVFKVEVDQLNNEVVTHVSEHAREEDARTQADALAALDYHLVSVLGIPENWVGQKYLVRTRPSKEHTIYRTDHRKFGVDYSPIFPSDLIGAEEIAD